jgi:hypothetical protein
MVSDLGTLVIGMLLLVVQFERRHTRTFTKGLNHCDLARFKQAMGSEGL